MDLDFDARYSVKGMPGVAFWLKRYDIQEEWDEEYQEYVETGGNLQQVVAVMVGDDREHIVDVDDLTLLSEDDYCSGCGQTGCNHG